MRFSSLSAPLKIGLLTFLPRIYQPKNIKILLRIVEFHRNQMKLKMKT
jgi:hypothetical protein